MGQGDLKNEKKKLTHMGREGLINKLKKERKKTLNLPRCRSTVSGAQRGLPYHHAILMCVVILGF